MLSKVLINRLLTNTTRTISSQSKNTLQWAIKRNASSTTTSATTQYTHCFDMSLGFKPLKETASTASVSEYVSRLRPFSAPPAPSSQPLITPNKVTEELELTSVLRKRRLKMNKHKHKKLRKRTRALRKRLGK